ncbi:MAG: polymer-forming cytoskeletal protein [Spirochaetia bacterium]|jgi:cytoskeletal protein CcmA (bactofilin family)
MAEVRIKDIDEHEIDTILAEDIDFEGHLTFKKPLMIKGKFKGEIKSTSALYIGEKAYVEATTEADVVSSKGRHKGDILGRSRVELFSTARVDGDITTPDFVVESGCKFNGNCNMGGETAKKETVAPPATPQGASGAGTSTGASANAQAEPPKSGAEATRGSGAAQPGAPGVQQRTGPEPSRGAPEAHRPQGGPQPQQQQQQQKPHAPQGGAGGQGGVAGGQK